jgi:predicted acylesterase/phospholipase RssA
VGALKYMLCEQKREYRHVHGVSVGSINGAGVAMWGLDAGEKLVELWYGLDNSKVAVDRFLSPISLAWSPSLMKVDPLRELLCELVDVVMMRNSGIDFSCYAVDICTEEMHCWTQRDEKAVLVEGMMASSMAPIVYPPVHMNGQVFYDAGIRDVAPIQQAIDAGADEIDVLLPESEDIGPWDADPDRVWNTAPRVLQIMVREIIRSDLRDVERCNELVAAGLHKGKRHIKMNLIRPKKPLPLDARDFDPEGIRKLIDMGYADAKAYWEAS